MEFLTNNARETTTFRLGVVAVVAVLDVDTGVWTTGGGELMADASTDVIVVEAKKMHTTTKHADKRLREAEQWVGREETAMVSD